MEIPTQFSAFSGIAGVSFEPLGSEGLIAIRIENAAATARITPHGGHVLDFRPRSQAASVLWLSDCSWYESGKPIRGGIPICWPWFGMHPDDPSKPAHGFARLMEWTLKSIERPNDTETRVVMELFDSPFSLSLWPEPFLLRLTVEISETLRCRLDMENRGENPVNITTALHTYFDIGNIRETRVLGLDGLKYLDSLTKNWHVQDGAVAFASETDRIYVDAPASCQILDPSRSRILHVRSEGSRANVVWNPWIDKSKRMPDFGDEEYNGMVCVETAATRQNPVTIGPGETASIGVHLECSPR
jgi:D-hexose-6-phosphate mutarotase